METLPQENLHSSAPGLPWKRLMLAFTLGLLWMALVATRLTFDSAHYQTVDGKYYLELAADFTEGKPMVLDGLQNQQGKSFSPYPPGYPMGLAVSKTLLPKYAAVFGPSWVFHGFLLMTLLMVWSLRFPLWPLGCLVFGDTFLSMGSATGSEFSFTWSLICMALALANLTGFPAGYRKWIWPVFFVLAFGFRYAAAFCLPWLLVFGAYAWVRNKTLSRALLQGWVAAMVVLGLYGGWEWVRYGQLTGGDRYPNQDTAQKLGLDLAKECLNQISWFRDFDPYAWPMFALGAGALLGLVATVKFAFAKRTSASADPANGVFLGLNLLGLGLSQILCTVGIRWYYYFAESFDLRLLGPGFSLTFLGALVLVAQKFVLRRPIWFLAFLVFALGFGFPKRPVFLKYQERFWDKVHWRVTTEMPDSLHK